jgi:isochorismate synthase
VYVFNIPGKGIWMGASPEVLLTGDNHKLLTTALAGTQKLDAKDLDQIRWSNKEIEEHAFIELFLESEFNGLEIDYSKSATYTKAAGKMCHIKSDFVLKSESRLNLVLNAIHPGPALSGYPKNAAMELLNKAEPHDREFYTGFLGPVGSDNKLHVYVNLRCMQVFKNGFLLYLGGGITKDSNPKSEWEETELKASTMESVLDTEEAIALKSQYDF